jgi:hypothetical protein
VGDVEFDPEVLAQAQRRRLLSFIEWGNTRGVRNPVCGQTIENACIYAVWSSEVRFPGFR